MFAGASGVGKTTSAKYVEDSAMYEQVSSNGQVSHIPFVSGSVSDLLPQTKEITHAKMLDRDSKDLYMEDFQILNLRKKLFIEKINEGSNFVCDRSFLDSAAYFIYKQADKIPSCEIDNFLNICSQLTTTLCTHLILFDFTPVMLKEWVTEDNNKRITNNYFQMEITSIMKMVLDLWCTEYLQEVQCISDSIFKQGTLLKYGASRGRLNTIYGNTEVLVIREVNMSTRNQLINKFINGKI